MPFVSIVSTVSDRWYYAALIEGCKERLRTDGYEVVVHRVPLSKNILGDVETLLNLDVMTGGCIGVIGHGVPYGSRNAAGEGVPIPVVTVDGTLPGIPSVVIDEVGIAREVTEYVLRRGHRRIAYVTASIDRDLRLTSEGRRLRGYRLAVGAANVETRICEIPSPADSRVLIAKLLAEPERATAVVCAWDELAFAVSDLATDIGLTVGVDVSIAGMDGHPRAIEQGLTTVNCKPNAMGASAAELMLELLSGSEGSGQHSRLQSTIFMRGNTVGERH